MIPRRLDFIRLTICSVLVVADDLVPLYFGDIARDLLIFMTLDLSQERMTSGNAFFLFIHGMVQALFLLIHLELRHLAVSQRWEGQSPVG